MMQSHGAQILQSPARLGIMSSNPSAPNPNPTSLPSTSNPNPNPKPSPAVAGTTTTTTTTSAALLPLLPPLPRAQALLLHMSLLSSKLFDLSSNRSFWVSSYRGTFPSFPPSSSKPSNFLTPSSTKEVLTLFTSLQTQLFESVAELQEILDLQDSKTKLTREIRSKDSTLLSFTKKIREAHNVLDQLTEDYSDYKSTINSSLDLQEILSYAHRISYTTFAPPEHGAGLPLKGALPPAPQDNEMRASQLYNVTESDLGLPAKKPKLTDPNERTVSTGTESPLLLPTPKRDKPVPVQLPITLSKMPNFPVELPPMPPGWKPGDAIKLDGIGFPGLLDGKRFPGSGIPVGSRNQDPAPIQVAHVQLDIDDNSSEYSSDDGSSDDDDED
ncbi:hypothetical protein LUZ60_011912 [Juncus effusus]|nr:hypothetical protein LUZ60_011912 [Juncus effusus]